MAIILLFALLQEKLDKITERKRLDGGNNTIRSRHCQKVCLFGHFWGSLEVDFDSCLSRFFLCGFVFLFTSQNFGLTLGFTHVLDAHMDALFNDAAIDFLVHTHPNRTLGDIENNSRASVVCLVWHALVDGWIGKDIHVVTGLDFHQVLTEVDGAMIPVLFREHVARSRAGSEGMRHGLGLN